MLLGTGFGGESLSLIEWLALAVIIFAVVLVTLGKYLFPVRSEATPLGVEVVVSSRIPAYRSARRVRRRRSTLPDAR